jgi:hypothetical protein
MLCHVGDFKHILGFVVDSTGKVAQDSTYEFKLPVTRVQGIACASASDTQFKFYAVQGAAGQGTYVLQSTEPRLLSLTYDRTTKNLLSQSVDMMVDQGCQEPMFIPSSTPSPLELWLVSESGTRLLQKRKDPAEDLYPFVYRVK